ncbi:MAG TPA: type III secretion system export apparatus subunit SctT [Alphaproteobacteria bacterium]|nr:type III secretion system export apparatus subunit SctT [Alphaproteobacteria bacterium]
MTGLDTLDRSMGIVFTYLVAVALAMARGVAMATVLPVFTRMGITGILRNGVALALALPLIPQIAGELSLPAALGPWTLIALALKEAFIGLLLGVAFGIPFWGAEAAGDVADLQRGASGAYLIDPSAAGEASVTGTLFVVVLLTVFFAAGGMTILADAYYRSYAIWPATAFLPGFSAELPGLLLGLLDRIMQLALIIAGPIILIMFVGDALLAIVSRFAPQLNVFDLSLSVKGAVFVLALPLYAVFLVDYLADSLAPLPGVVDLAAEFLK